ncbi:hypothetical protein GOP47_0005453 [Adiantum capillus-veneris]|uniref:Uncharacterized protein n=1 Tax=Adiantum capillus-veneris TaxID=13818 RepID=A0A9D4ZLL1_ADICA|nr:hypothetical protein GOP47_0005453 [Adiantum capillus-veneris]
MQLRSGRQFGTILGSKAASRVPTQGSSSPSLGNLDNIVEDSCDYQLETISRTLSRVSMDHEESQDMHPQASTFTRPISLNPFETHDDEGLALNTKLQFVYTNAQGAEIFKDPLQHYVVKIANIVSDLDRAPWDNDQGSMYMGRDGARYEITTYPEIVGRMGEFHPSGTLT